MVKKCLNPKVLAGLAVIGVGIWLLAPGLLTRAVPLLALAACPLSMILMMVAMRGTSSDETGAAASPSQANSPEALEVRLRALEAEQAALAEQLDAGRRQESRVTG
ncbi:MAG: DUF2933 domain-containing protein [Egibacteraceae bacterium]